jgi:diguanylate cyclase (GGDEF)-like protein/PAS domain S-box-containing protein
MVRAVWAAYPILDAVLLALVVHAAARRVPGVLPLGVGVAFWLFSDFLYMLQPGSPELSRWFDAGWMMGAMVMAAATWQSPSTRAPKRRGQGVGKARVALVFAPLMVPGIIELVGFSQGVDPNPIPLFGATIVLAILAFARTVVILRAGHRAEAELRAAEQHFRALVQRSSDSAFVLGPDGRIRYASAAVSQFGYAPDELVGQIGWELIHPDDLPNAVAAFGVVAQGAGISGSAELRLRDAAGEWRWVEEVVTNLFDEPGVEGLVANIRDISTRKAAELELSRLAHYDELTGLPNRWLLTQQLTRALESSAESFALLSIDLDQFKFVNDSLGHATGDQLLQAVAARLGAILGEHDTLGRIGGDEFAIISRDATNAKTADDRKKLVQVALGEPIAIPGSGSFHITASIGVTIARTGDTPERLLQQADTAMYAAKAQGPGQSVIFDDRLRQRAEERLTIQAELRIALRSNQLVVHYQPVIDLATGELASVEALVRWRHPDRGLLLPADFIPIAEQSDLIDLVGRYVLEQACTDAASWARMGHALAVAVNVSAAQLRNEHIADLVQQTLYDTGLEARLLILEITETALLLAAERATSAIEVIRALGVTIALDDFGTGYSSLSFLKRIPADIVKIDRSFIADIEHNPADRDIAAAIIDIARALGRAVIAEGIETEAQHSILEGMGCPLAQGYLWSAAVPAEAVLPLAAELTGARPELHPVPG